MNRTLRRSANLALRWRALPYSAGADPLTLAYSGPMAVEWLTVAGGSLLRLPASATSQPPRFFYRYFAGTHFSSEERPPARGAWSSASWGSRTGGAGRGALSEVRHDLAGEASEALAAP